MNKRMMRIMEELASSAEPLTLARLAQVHGVSQRTIRNDINAINKLLDGRGAAMLNYGHEGAILVPDGFEQEVRSIRRSDFTSYKLSKGERQLLAAALLVSSTGYTTLAAIAEALSVSRATVIADLDGVKDFVATRGLEVCSHSSKGLTVEGLESVKRAFLLSLPDEQMIDESLRQFGMAAQLGVQAGDGVTIRKIVVEQERSHGLSLTDESFAQLKRYLGIMVGRRLQDEEVEDVAQGGESRYLAFAEGIVSYVEQYSGLSHSEAEARYLATLLAGYRYLAQNDFTTDDVRIQMLTREFIRDVSQDLGIDLNGDYSFFEMLSNHLESMLAVDAVAVSSDSPLREVVEEHPEVYQAVLRPLSVFEGYGGRSLTDDDIVFVVIHVCAAIERKRNAQGDFRIIVACHAGMATSHFLLERLKVRFNFHVVDVLSAHEAEGLASDAADLVISTVPLQHCPIEYLVVQPIPTDDDYARVGNKIDAIKNARSYKKQGDSREQASKALVERIDTIVRRIVSDQADELMVAIRREVRRFTSESTDMEGELLAPYLHELLFPAHIVLDVECADWREAIATAARPLLEEGYITQDYIDAMIANTEESGPYYLLGKGFAVPHAGLGEGSIKMGMSLVRLAHPVSFEADDEELDEVEFVCCLSPIDHSSHLKAFFHLMNMVAQTDLPERLHAVATPAQATQVIMQIERGLEI